MIFVCIYIFFIYIKRTVILWSSLSTSCCWTVDGLPSKACFTCITSVLKVELTLLNITIQGLWEMLQIPYSLCLLNYFLFLLFILNGRKRLLYILQWMDEVFFFRFEFSASSHYRLSEATNDKSPTRVQRLHRNINVEGARPPVL